MFDNTIFGFFVNPDHSCTGLHLVYTHDGMEGHGDCYRYHVNVDDGHDHAVGAPIGR